MVHTHGYSDRRIGEEISIAVALEKWTVQCLDSQGFPGLTEMYLGLYLENYYDYHIHSKHEPDLVLFTVCGGGGAEHRRPLHQPRNCLGV